MNQLNHPHTRMILATAVPFFAYLVAPLGVAGQNIGLGLALLSFIALTVSDRGQSLKLTLATPVARQYMILWALIIIPITAATVAKDAGSEASRFFWGYLYSCAMVIGGLSLRSEQISRKFLLNQATFLMGLMGLVAASQFLFGWKFQGAQIVDQIKRAQGFYSHPLTFAYAALTLMPWCFARVMGRPHQWQSWVLALSMLIVVITSQSVTVICISLLTLLFLMTQLLSKKQFVSFAIAGAILTTLGLSVPNPLQRKFSDVLSGQRGDHETPYADDRIAFWHAHWEMIKDKPITGHGTGLESADRQPYYARIGLPNLSRPYEAHNMYLQYAVEGGLIPAVALMAFLIWWFIRSRRDLKNETWFRLAMQLTPVGFALGGLTQNAVQDSEVRYMLLLFCAVCLHFSQPDHVPVEKLN